MSKRRGSVTPSATPDPMRKRTRRAALPERTDAAPLATQEGMTHEGLVAALRGIDGLRDVGTVHPNFRFRSRPFLHFHHNERGTYADVRFGSGDFEPVWVSTPAERLALLARVSEHVERITQARKPQAKRRRHKRD
jgi:hypothetical protein